MRLGNNSMNSPIFRNEAIEQYRRRRDKTTLPKFIPFPVMFLLWGLLVLLLVAGGLAWYEQIPIYTTAAGTVLDQNSQGAKEHAETVAALFLSTTQASSIHVGQGAMVQIGSATTQFASTIVKLEPTVTSPQTLRQRYGAGANVVTEPSIVALIQFKDISSSSYVGSFVVATVQIGSQRIIALFPGIGSFVRG
jgi:hypothetical protein